MTGMPLTQLATAQEFAEAVAAPLERGDLAGVLAALQRRWSCADLLDLLFFGDSRVVRMATRCLGLIGDSRHCCPLVSLLGHNDPQIVAAAEDALWHVWMRAGRPRSNKLLAVAVADIRDQNFEGALRALEEIISEEPDFAEPHHQRGIVLHSLDRLDEAESAYAAALRLNPHHFAAAAALGHVCAQRGDLRGALRGYRGALHIHPQLQEIREIVPKLEAAIRRRDVA
jgi:tetratricopeptide (TPR) repeat protein